MKSKLVILDDEKDAINVISILCKSNPEVEVVYTNTNASEALVDLAEIDFDVLFLDIHMPGLSGFEFLEKFGRSNFQLVFITAYDNYALHAFRLSAIDYLQKPVDPELFQIALEKACKYKELKDAQLRLNIMKENLSSQDNPKRIIVPTSNGFVVEKVDSIITLIADGSYTEIRTIEGKKYLISQTLKSFTYLLELACFERVHHGHIINLNHLKEFKKTDGGQIVLSDGQVVSVSVRKRGNFLNNLKAYMNFSK